VSYLPKFVPCAIDLSDGEENGRRNGRMLPIVAGNVAKWNRPNT